MAEMVDIPCRCLFDLTLAIMEIDESITLLREHNAWRRGAETEMHDPRKIGEAIDTLIKAVEILLENRTLRAMNDELEKVMPKGEISDGYHTFDELYEHRHALFLAFMASHPAASWISRKHADGSSLGGWFIAGMVLPWGGAEISYHLPDKMWDLAKKTGARVFETGLPWDGHTPSDVVKRLHDWVSSSNAVSRWTER